MGDPASSSWYCGHTRRHKKNRAPSSPASTNASTQRHTRGTNYNFRAHKQRAYPWHALELQYCFGQMVSVFKQKWPKQKISKSVSPPTKPIHTRYGNMYVCTEGRPAGTFMKPPFLPEHPWNTPGTPPEQAHHKEKRSMCGHPIDILCRSHCGQGVTGYSP